MIDPLAWCRGRKGERHGSDEGNNMRTNEISGCKYVFRTFSADGGSLRIIDAACTHPNGDGVCRGDDILCPIASFPCGWDVWGERITRERFELSFSDPSNECRLHVRDDAPDYDGGGIYGWNALLYADGLAGRDVRLIVQQNGNNWDALVTLRQASEAYMCAEIGGVL